MKFSQKTVATAAVALLVGAAWVAVFARLSNPSLLFRGYNSDDAMPVLMSNDDTFHLESLYYWAQDRFSGTPFFILSLVHKATGFFWTPSGLAIVQALWCGSSALVIWRWSGRVSMALAWATMLLVGGVWTDLLFELAQPYAWQLTWLCLAAWVMSCRLEETGFGGWKGGVLFFLLTWQAQAANAMSGTWLGVLAVVELALARGRTLRVIATVVLPIALAITGEWLLRRLYWLRYWREHRVNVASPLGINLEGALDSYAVMRSWFDWWHLGALVACLLVAVAALRWRTIPRWLVYPAAFFVMNVLQPSVVTHIQISGTAQKYFTLAGLLGPWVVVAGLALVLESRGWWWPLVPSVALVPFGPLVRPLPPPDLAFDAALRTANELSRTVKSGFLASGYWETYALASLTPNVKPVSRHRQSQRTHHLFEEISRTDSMWLGCRGTDGNPERDLEFWPHVLVGRTLFVPQGERFVGVGEAEFRRYRRAKVSWSKRSRVCPDEPLVVDGRGTLVLFDPSEVVFTVDELEGPAPTREGTAWLWQLDGHLTVRTNECVDTFAFITDE